MRNPEELYAGLTKETAEEYRAGAMEKYGKEAVETAEKALLKGGKAVFEQLKVEAENIAARLYALKGEDPASNKVQAEIANHYKVTRQFSGTAGLADKQADAYAGLGKLYVSDERFTMRNGTAQPAFAEFLSKAMTHFAKEKLS